MAHQTRQKPWGFRDFVKIHGYCSVYLLDVGGECPIKVGITDNPERRLSDFQIAHFRALKFHSVWWLPGKAIAARLENAFKYYFYPEHIRGEWYDVTCAEAADFIEETIESLGTWGISQAKIEDRMIAWLRKRHDIPHDAPSKECGLRTMRSRQIRW
jgi:hypothetical protein